MIQEEIILKSIERKLGIIGNCQMSADEIQKSFTKDELNLIEKSKYIRREGVKGNYKYVYEEPKQDKNGKDGDYVGKDKLNDMSVADLKTERQAILQDTSIGYERRGEIVKEISDKITEKEQQPEKKEEISVGDRVTVLNANRYDALAPSTISGTVLSIDRDGRIEVKYNEGALYVNLKDVQKSLDTPEHQVAQIMKSIKEGQLKDEQGNTITDITKAFEIVVHDNIEKSQKANVGDVHIWNGKKFKKQPNGKWLEVSESHGMTKIEHEDKGKHSGDSSYKHTLISDKLSDKEHSDEEVGLGEKTDKREKVSRKNHEDLLKLVLDIDINNSKSKKLKSSAIDEVIENLKSEPEEIDYSKALKLIQDYAANDKGKTIKENSIWSISNRIEDDLEKFEQK